MLLCNLLFLIKTHWECPSRINPEIYFFKIHTYTEPQLRSTPLVSLLGFAFVSVAVKLGWNKYSALCYILTNWSFHFNRWVSQQWAHRVQENMYFQYQFPQRLQCCTELLIRNSWMPLPPQPLRSWIWWLLNVGQSDGQKNESYLLLYFAFFWVLALFQVFTGHVNFLFLALFTHIPCPFFHMVLFFL